MVSSAPSLPAEVARSRCSLRALPVLGLALITGGCASPGLYDWGGYDSGLYTAYKDPTQAVAVRQQLETHVAAIEKSGQKVGPGLYADLGTFYLQANDRDRAISYYERERAHWPESQVLMTAMIENLRRRPQGQQGQQGSKPPAAGKAADRPAPATAGEKP